MTRQADRLLVEIGAEELPPKALRMLSEAFAAELVAELDAAGLAHGVPAPCATPRRLAILVPDVPGVQPDRDLERRGPPLARAFDEDGQPTQAALGFARSVGVEVDRLVRIETGDGAWLGFRSTIPGTPLRSLLPGMVERALGKLPAPRRMRWADRDTEFVRPVHWVVLMHGAEVIEAEVLGIPSGRATRGHRFHHPGDIVLEDAGDYATALRRQGHVVAGFDERMEMIREQVEQAGKALGGRALIDPALLEENTALVEWPVAVAGHFDTDFLDLPDAVLVATMQGHQRYFPVAGRDGALMPHFIAVSNIESRNPATVREGNERVVRPRLSDAAYFFDTDRGRSLESRLGELEGVIFQRRLGSLRAKAQRVAKLAGRVARAMGGSDEAVAHARRAGLLSKCDLVTEMVGEFPELQGEMGREYARIDGEPAAVADAVGEIYMPRFADDGIPATTAGRAIAIADKIDTIAGCLSLGLVPSGDKDPFALRRAALGTLRIMMEGELDLDLDEVIEAAFECYADQMDEAPGAAAPQGHPEGMAVSAGTASAGTPSAGTPSAGTAPTGTPSADTASADIPSADTASAGTPSADTAADTTPTGTASADAAPTGTAPTGTASADIPSADTASADTAPTGTVSTGIGAEARRFMLDRLRAYFADRSIPTDVFNAVLAREPTRPLDFANRVRAVETFRALPEAASLAAANKRIRNILRQAEQGHVDVPGAVDPALFLADAERSLAGALAGIEPQARAMLDAGEYAGALTSLAKLRDDVDRFFDTVKVMDDDAARRGNRLALLARIGALFMETADISLLQSTGG